MSVSSWHLITLITLYSLLLDRIDSLSACDEVDVTFLLDTDSIINNGDSIIEFITSIIWSGSSEHAGFSVVLYGDDIPIDVNINVITLGDTVNIHQRQNEEEKIAEILDNVFNKIEYHENGDDETEEALYDWFALENVEKDSKKDRKTVDLLAAFKMANKQITPNHQHKKQEKFGEEFSGNNIGKHDDDKAYFIFDHFNKLLHEFNEDENESDDDDESNNDLCEIFKHLNENKISNDDESIHFMMAQYFDHLDIVCDGKELPESLMKDNTFYHFTEEFVDDTELMEEMYDITCPAIIESKEFHGNVNLGNHNQWIDIDTIIKCSLKYIDHDNDPSTPNELDVDESYIEIKDFINDDNTFKINDYLLSDPKTYEKLKEIDCTSPVFKIHSMEIVDDSNDKYKVVKLFVILPETPMDYLLDANVFGEVPLSEEYDNNDDNHGDDDGEYNEDDVLHINGRRLLGKGDKTSEAKGNSVKKGKGKTMKLLNINFKKDFKWEKTGKFAKTIGGGGANSNSPSITFKGSGTITLEYGFWFNLKVDLFFRFFWQILKGNIHIEFKIHGHWDVGAYFNAKLRGDLEIIIKNLLNWGQQFTFFIGPVPVLIKPYVQLNARLKTIPLQIYGGIKCRYAEKFAMGYYYDKKVVPHPKYSVIKKNTVYTMKTKKTWTKIDNVDKCATKVHQHGLGGGLSCKWFEYNKSKKTCRCKGSKALKGKIKADKGWTAYILKRVCDKTYKRQCKGCGINVWIEKDGKNRPCKGRKAKKGKKKCKCLAGRSNWKCKKCKLKKTRREKIIKKHPIKEREIIEKGCTKKFGIGDEEENDKKKCPVTQLGFDVIIEPKIGVILYVIINVYLRLEFVFPFRITLPEMDSSICKISGKKNMCEIDKYLRASFTIEAYLNLYLGVSLDIGKLGQALKKLFGGKKKKKNNQNMSNDLKAEKKLNKKKIVILKKKTLGCIKLKGLLAPLNKHYRSKCCSQTKSAAFDTYNMIKIPSPKLIFSHQRNNQIKDELNDKQIATYYGEDYDFYEDLIYRRNKLKQKLMTNF